MSAGNPCGGRAPCGTDIHQAAFATLFSAMRWPRGLAWTDFPVIGGPHYKAAVWRLWRLWKPEEVGPQAYSRSRDPRFHRIGRDHDWREAARVLKDVTHVVVAGFEPGVSPGLLLHAARVMRSAGSPCFLSVCHGWAPDSIDRDGWARAEEPEERARLRERFAWSMADQCARHHLESGPARDAARRGDGRDP